MYIYIFILTGLLYIYIHPHRPLNSQMKKLLSWMSCLSFFFPLSSLFLVPWDTVLAQVRQSASASARRSS